MDMIEQTYCKLCLQPSYCKPLCKYCIAEGYTFKDGVIQFNAAKICESCGQEIRRDKDG